MSETLLPDSLSPSEVRQVEQVCDRFEAAWKGGERPRLEQYLGDAEESLRATLLRHLLPLEWEYRLRAGDRPDAAEYVARFPDVDALVETVERETAAAARTLPGTSLPAPATGGGAPIPRRLGKYRILREVGRGGMGIVYEAVHQSLGRRVAIKVLLGMGLADPTARQRFRREAQTTARLHHPNIVQIFEVGEHDGSPFLALEFVAGPSLADRLRDAPEPPARAAAIVETLARAVHHAHEQGVVHRDLKPANVLLVEGGGWRVEGEDPRPSSPSTLHPPPSTPKITDFGLAHPVGGGDLTATGVIVGTPGYMAPEQAWGKIKSKPVGPAADVYALGAILYECLTGRPPFQGATALETLELVRSQEPVPPTHLQPNLPRDLETVCLKCLEKEPARRYATAGDLAEDLRRFGAGESIAARPAGRLERAIKWARRRPAVAAMLGVSMAAAAVVLGVVVAFSAVLVERNWNLGHSLELQHQAEETARLKAEEAGERAAEAMSARKEAEEEKKKADDAAKLAAKQRDAARSHLFTAQLTRVAAFHETDPKKALSLLHDCNACPINLRDEAWRFYENACRGVKPVTFPIGGSAFSSTAVVFSPDGKTLAAAGWGKHLALWEASTGKKLATLQVDNHVHGVAFSPNGRTLATAGGGFEVANDKPLSWGELKLWDVDTAQERAAFQGHNGRVWSVAFSPDGKALAAGCADGTVVLWDPATGHQRAALQGHDGRVKAVAFSPDGKMLASGGEDKTVRLWDLATGQEHMTLAGHDGWVGSVAFSPDGKTLASAGGTTMRLWEVGTGKECGTQKRKGGVYCVAFSPGGRTLATAGGSDFDAETGKLRHWGELQLWDVVTGHERAALPGHETEVHSVAFSPDGHTLASASWDGMVRLLPIGPGPLHATLPASGYGLRTIAFSPDGKTLASGGDDKTVRLWDLTTGQERAAIRGHVHGVTTVAFSPDSQTLASGGFDAQVRLVEAATGEVRTVLPGYALAFSPDGTTVATSGLAVFGPNNERTHTWEVKLWEIGTGKERAALKDLKMIRSLAFSPDGRMLAGGGPRGVPLWEVATGKWRVIPTGHDVCNVMGVTFSPDGRTLAAALVVDYDRGEIKLWDVATGQETARLKGPERPVYSVVFSPDGKTVAAAYRKDGGAAEVRVWEVDTGRERATFPAVWEGNGSPCVAFSPDGKLLALGSLDGTVRLLRTDMIPDAGQ